MFPIEEKDAYSEIDIFKLGLLQLKGHFECLVLIVVNYEFLSINRGHLLGLIATR